MEKILVLQMTRLGDLVQTLPLLRRLRQEYPAAHTTLVCQAGVQGILSGCTYCDRVVALSPSAGPDFPHPEFNETYDLLINVTSDLESAVLCKKIAATVKLGRIDTFPGELRLLGPWSKYLFAMVSNRVDNLFNIVDIQTGMAGFLPKPQQPALEVQDVTQNQAKALLQTLGRHSGRHLIAMQTGASQLHRAWSLENFSALARDLVQKEYADIVLLGDGSERERAESLKSQIGLPVLDLVGRTSLELLPAILAECDLLISNDTGTIHVAAAVGTRTLGLFFSTAYFSETAPYGVGHAILQVEIPCSPCHASAPCPVQLCREFLSPMAVSETVHWILDGTGDIPVQRPNLSLYLSRFLSNGSMIYLPVHVTISSHFLKGLLGRLLWEGTLGLSIDPDLEAIWKTARLHPDWEDKRTAMVDSLEALRGPFAQGLNLAAKLKGEFSVEAPLRQRIQMLHQQLTDLGASMAGATKNGGLFGDFLKYEMMDMDYVGYPQLAEVLEEKYRRLFEWTQHFQTTLARLLPLLS